MTGAQTATVSILLVEDHKELAQTVIEYLERMGYIVDYAADGLSALHLVAVNQYDVIILDINLPGVDGLTLCERIRDDARLSTPVIMLTARDQLADKERAFTGGADDYLVKPFELPELVLRLKAIVRRQRGELGTETYRVGDLTMDARTGRVERAGQVLKLTPTCLKILRILMRESPNLVKREDMERELWGELTPDTDTLRSHLYNLRRAIDRPFDTALLETQLGAGFRLRDDATSA